MVGVRGSVGWSGLAYWSLSLPRDGDRLHYARQGRHRGWAFGPGGVLHLDPLRSAGALGGCREREPCGPAGHTPDGRGWSPTHQVCGYTPITKNPTQQ